MDKTKKKSMVVIKKSQMLILILIFFTSFVRPTVPPCCKQFLSEYTWSELTGPISKISGTESFSSARPILIIAAGNGAVSCSPAARPSQDQMFILCTDLDRLLWISFQFW